MKVKPIPFNLPLVLGNEMEYIQDAIKRREFSGGGYYTQKSEEALSNFTGSPCLLTSSCTHALEMAAFLIDIKEGDEVIMSSFNFVSAANAFVIRGAKIIFVDIRPDTLNINENLIEQAITKNTKAIVAMHYGGVPCNMDVIMDLASKHSIYVIEDAAHCIGAYYKNNHLGAIGHIGTLSFHSTKNIQCGEGGALIVNDEQFLEQAYIIREKGTNRRSFKEGKVDKYTWVGMGSSYLLGEVGAAFLYAQILQIKDILEVRIQNWKTYDYHIQAEKLGKASEPGNGHIFFLLCENQRKRDELQQYLREYGIDGYFHYIPLHTSRMGRKYGRFIGKDVFTSRVSQSILRLPFYKELSESDIINISSLINSL